MPRTAFTSSEWADFCNGFNDPDNAWKVACHIWEEEREADLNKWKEFVDQLAEEDKKEGWDMLEALYALYTTESSIYHEIEDRFRMWLYDEGYRSEEYRYESYESYGR